MNKSNETLEMERMPTFAVFIAVSLTFGLFTVIWLLARSKDINKMSDGNVKIWLIKIFGLLWALYVTLLFVSVPAIFVWVALGAYFVVYVWVVFDFKSELEGALHNAGIEVCQLSSLLSFLLSVIYFQFKINQALDELNYLNNEKST